jgi:hypothetical protein
MKKFLLLLVSILFIQSIVQADPIQCTQKGNKTTCYVAGKVATTATTRAMSNGFVEVETCNTMFPVCEYHIMSPLESQAFIRQVKSGVNSVNQMVIEQQKKEKQGKATIVKQVSINTPTGKKVTLEEDGLGDDYLIINGERKLLDEKKFGNRLATYKEDIVYRQVPDNFYELKQVMAREQEQDKGRGINRSYEEIIYNSNELRGLFKLVYRLRVEEGVSLEDAQKLMTFAKDNGSYKPEDLLLLSEIQTIKFQKTYSDAYEKIKDIKFPAK